jgi:HK97 gp10 family phage protein
MANRYKTPIVAKIDTDSLESTIRSLREVDRKAARKAIRKGVSQVTKLVLAAAKRNVPKRTGLLRKSLGRFVKSSNSGAGVVGIVKPRGGVKVKRVWVPKFRKTVGKQRFQKSTRAFTGDGTISPLRYAHLVEFGRSAVTTKRKKLLSGGGQIWGVKVRAVPPRPFMRPAWEEYKSAAPGIIEQYLSEAIRDFWRKRRG